MPNGPAGGTIGAMPVPYLACMSLVAHLYALPPRVLPAIQRVEGGAPGAVHRNRDGTADLGVMQVNTLWIPALVRYTRTGRGTVTRRLTTEPCYNIAAAGAIMRTYLDEAHGNLLRAVGDYHSHTDALNRLYQVAVLRAATVMFVRQGGARRG